MTIIDDALLPGISRAERLTPLVIKASAGEALPDELAFLETDKDAWIATVVRLLADTEDTLDVLNDTLRGPHRAQVLADYERERERLDRTFRSLIGLPDHDRPGSVEEGHTVLQLSWEPGRVIAWAGGNKAPLGDLDEVHELLELAGAPTKVWGEHPPITVPGATGTAAALQAPMIDLLGWLVALGADPTLRTEVGPSATWLGKVAVLAVKLVAQGRMVPSLARTDPATARRGRPEFHVQWGPALLEPQRLEELGQALPGALLVLGQRNDRRAAAQQILDDVVHQITVTGAQRLDLPAPPPTPRQVTEVAETVLARLDGSSFDAPTKAGAEVARRIERWTRLLANPSRLRLTVRLDPPDSGGAWYLAVLAPGPDRDILPVEKAMVTTSNTKGKEIEEHLARLERLYPPLLRPGTHRRGEVILSQDEAWRLMTEEGAVLEAAGFEVQVPPLSRRRPSAALRLAADPTTETVVGAQQLANVRWSALFDDVELTVAEIQRLAAQARPLVQSRGRWVELDHADLAEAARALADRAKTTQLTGAEMLRHALGLEGTAFGGRTIIEGSGWAADLLKRATELPAEPTTTPDGFQGKLRTYQAEALAWLGFLDAAGLGGCLALDMGLGKTPTVLAHLRRTKGDQPSLVVAPPAVVGNWAAEAAKFTPGLRVVVHHGANRDDDVGRAARRADMVLTTYGTAVRDIDQLAAIQWSKVVLDEAQVIKNPTSETAQQLRRLDAQTRVALTGTPIENGLGDLWAILDFTNPGLVGPRAAFITQLSREGSAADSAESALRALNGLLVFRRTKAEPAIAAELPDRIDELDYCSMTPEQIGLYQAVVDQIVRDAETGASKDKKGQVLAAITALKQICNHPSAYRDTGEPLAGRSGKLARLEEIVESVFASGERLLVFTHFAQWGDKLARYLTAHTGVKIECYHGGLARGVRDRMVHDFQRGTGPGALVLSLKAGGTGLNLTAANHVVLYDRWWNPAVEDQARDRVWRIGQKNTVICHRLVCPGTVDERVEEVVAGKRRIADMVLPKSSSIDDLDADQLRSALGIRDEFLLVDDDAPEPIGASS